MIKKLRCLKCGHRWVPRKEDVKECPRCKNRDWDKPKKRKQGGFKNG